VRGLGAIIVIARVGCKLEEGVSLFGVHTRPRGECVREDGTLLVGVVKSQTAKEVVARELGDLEIVEREGERDDGSNRRMVMGEDLDIKYVFKKRFGYA
jgi:hypothetical protein